MNMAAGATAIEDAGGLPTCLLHSHALSSPPSPSDRGTSCVTRSACEARVWSLLARKDESTDLCYCGWEREVRICSMLILLGAKPDLVASPDQTEVDPVEVRPPWQEGTDFAALLVAPSDLVAEARCLLMGREVPLEAPARAPC